MSEPVGPEGPASPTPDPSHQGRGLAFGERARSRGPRQRGPWSGHRDAKHGPLPWWEGQGWGTKPALLAAFAALVLAATAAQPAPEFRVATAGYRFAFPRDHASHPAYKTEWWYYTGHLQAAGGRRFGYQLTFFRSGVSRKQQGPSRWRVRDLYLAHFAIADEGAGRLRFGERQNRAGLGMADAETRRYRVFNGAWEAWLEAGRHRLQARHEDLAIDLALTPRKPPVIHGRDGISRKAGCPGCASHYYSLTRLQTAGTLQIAGARLQVTGISWMDHEFGSDQLPPGLAGWDWFSLQLADGSELMLYRLRRDDGAPVPESSGTYVRADGTWVHLARAEFAIEPAGSWTSPRSGGRYPMGWRVQVPSEGLDLHLAPAFEDQELDTTRSTGVIYWEGSVHATGTRRGAALAGDGYVEMTGYAARFRQRI